MSQSIRDAFKSLDEIEDIDLTYDNHKLVEKVTKKSVLGNRHLNESIKNKLNETDSRDAKILKLKQILGISEGCSSQEGDDDTILTEDAKEGEEVSVESVREWLKSYGATLDVKTRKAVNFDSGYQVSFHDSEVTFNDIDLNSDEDIQRVVDELESRFESAETPYTGLWLDDGVVYVDNSEWISDEETAREVGNREEQKAIWDWANVANIYLNKDSESEDQTEEEVESEKIEEIEPVESQSDEVEDEVQEDENESSKDVSNLTADEIFEIVDHDLNGDDVAVQIGNRVFICETDSLPADGFPEDETFKFKGCEVTADDIEEVDGQLMMQDCGEEKEYNVVSGKVEEDVSESLVESKKINLLDNKDVEDGKQYLKKSEEEPTETIVDVDADQVDKLKDSYMGMVILRCPVCGELIYKEADKLVKADDTDLYNIDDECPHCGSVKGYELVGQVAKADSQDAKDLEDEEQPVDEPEEEQAEQPEDSEVQLEEPQDEEVDGKGIHDVDDENVEFESLNTHSFNKLITEHLSRTYNNVSNFAINNYKVNENNLVIEGRITYKSGNIKPTKFIFEARDNQLIGFNKQLSTKDDAFSITYKLDNKSIIAESLKYSYSVNNNLVEGVIR